MEVCCWLIVIIGGEEGHQAFEPTSNRIDNTLDPERSDDKDEDSQDGPMNSMNGWEEFDADAVYQKKHVNPEMR